MTQPHIISQLREFGFTDDQIQKATSARTFETVEQAVEYIVNAQEDNNTNTTTTTTTTNTSSTSTASSTNDLLQQLFGSSHSAPSQLKLEEYKLILVVVSHLMLMNICIE
jgi:hypothetical protein